jgi:hypothetical protein
MLLPAPEAHLAWAGLRLIGGTALARAIAGASAGPVAVPVAVPLAVAVARAIALALARAVGTRTGRVLREYESRGKKRHQRCGDDMPFHGSLRPPLSESHLPIQTAVVDRAGFTPARRAGMRRLRASEGARPHENKSNGPFYSMQLAPRIICMAFGLQRAKPARPSMQAQSFRGIALAREMHEYSEGRL